MKKLKNKGKSPQIKKPHKQKKTNPWEFKKGNRIWEQRSKHGRDTLFKTPNLLWEAACEYFKWIDDNPSYKAEWKNNRIIGLPVRKPYTLQGLCGYLQCGTKYFNNFKITEAYKSNIDFQYIIEQIEETIYNQKFSGAAEGFFKENIIARSLGLKDNFQNDVKVDTPIQITGMEIK